MEIDRPWHTVFASLGGLFGLGGSRANKRRIEWLGNENRIKSKRRLHRSWVRS